jgi:hypothetical protein
MRSRRSKVRVSACGVLLGAACAGPELTLSHASRDAGADVAVTPDSASGVPDAAVEPDARWPPDARLPPDSAPSSGGTLTSNGGAGNAPASGGRASGGTSSGGISADSGTGGSGGVEPSSGGANSGGTAASGGAGGTMSTGGRPSTGGTAACQKSADCRTCCDQQVPSGENHFTTAYSACICDTCRNVCDPTTCAGSMPPNDMCFICVVKTGICNPQNNDCSADTDCFTWLNCISSCL